MLQTGIIQYSGTPEMIEHQDLRVIDNMKFPRMFHTHLNYQFIPKMAKDGQLKIIYLVRNPKDVACSSHIFQSKLQNASYTGNFDGFLNAFLSEEFLGYDGSWFTHTKEWNTARLTNPDLKILFLKFEDMKKNLHTNIVQIAKFLEVNDEERFLKKVEEAVGFENLKKEHATRLGESDRWKHLGDNGRMPIYRKGIVGDWKTKFTVAQNEKFDEVFEEKMEDISASLDIVYE